MRSFALWYSSKNIVSIKEATVHINLWDKVEKKEKNYCFDFGILVENIEDIDKIYLYVPFQIEKNQIKDLGSVISNNQLVNAIFNENFTTTDGEPKSLVVNGNEEKPKFVIYALEVERQIKLNSCKRGTETPGTILEIDVGGIQPIKNISRYYFRIRIKVNSKDIQLINDEIKGISVFSDQFTNTEVIDFRLNDIRSCSEELREQFKKGKAFCLKAVHYLILRDADDIIIHYGKELNSRMLEKNLWSNYIDGYNHNIIAYHIKSKYEKQIDSITQKIKYKYVEDFSDLTRFQYQKGTKKIIMVYVLFVIGLGTIGSVIGNCLPGLLIGIGSCLYKLLGI